MPSEVFAVNQLYLKEVAVLTLAFMQQIRLQVSQQQKNSHRMSGEGQSTRIFQMMSWCSDRVRLTPHSTRSLMLKKKGTVIAFMTEKFVLFWLGHSSGNGTPDSVFLPCRMLPLSIGEHDFSSSKPVLSRASKVRTIHDITIQRYTGGEYEADNEVWIEIEGNGFLYNMVRIIVGTLLMVGSGKRPEIWASRVLADKQRTSAGPTAPAHGLLLLQITLKPQLAAALHAPSS